MSAEPSRVAAELVPAADLARVRATMERICGEYGGYFYQTLPERAARGIPMRDDESVWLASLVLEATAVASGSTRSLQVPDPLYEAACAALQKCSDVRECHDCASTAARLVFWARRAGDKRQRDEALRIQLRALRRLGQLLLEVPTQPGRRTDLQPCDGPVTRLGRAAAIGLSTRQAHTARRIASAMPETEFEKTIEDRQKPPPTMSDLASLGTVKRTAPRAPQPPPIKPARLVWRTAALLRHLAVIMEARPEISAVLAAHGFETAELRRYSQLLRELAYAIKRRADAVIAPESEQGSAA